MRDIVIVSLLANGLLAAGLILSAMAWGRRGSRLWATKTDLQEMEGRINMKQAELAVALDALTAQQGKIAKEQSDRFDAQAAKIQELTDAINAGGDVSPEVQAALDGLKVATQSLDDAIPDAPV